MNLRQFQMNVTPEQANLIYEITEIDTHWIDKAYLILKLKEDTGFSERDLAKVLGISKSEIHRLLVVGRLSLKAREAFKKLKSDKWAVYELMDQTEKANSETVKKASKLMMNGAIKTRSQLRNYLCLHGN